MKITHSKEEKLKAAMEVVNKGILTKPRRYTVSLQNVQGSATFNGRPSKELLEAVNKMAELAYYKNN